jgi:hypothetical protein
MTAPRSADMGTRHLSDTTDRIAGEFIDRSQGPRTRADLGGMLLIRQAVIGLPLQQPGLARFLVVLIREPELSKGDLR